MCADVSTGYERMSNYICGQTLTQAECGRFDLIGDEQVQITTPGTTYTELGADCDDAVSGAGVVTISGDTVNTAVPGVYTIDYSCEYEPLDDLARTVTVQDITNPELTLTGDASVNVEAGTTYTDAGATCSDDFDGVITPTSVSTVNTGVSGTYTVTWSCSDTSGNSDDDVVRTVVVADTIAPTMSVTGGTSIQVEADMTEFYTDAGATCSDTFEGNLDAQVQVGGDIVRRSFWLYTVDYTCWIVQQWLRPVVL